MKQMRTIVQTAQSATTFTLSVLISFMFAASGCDGPVRLDLSPAEVVSINRLQPEATEIIRQGLADQDPLIRTNAIEVVANTRQILLMPQVQRLLSDRVVPVRFAAALAVGDTEYHLAADAVKKIINDEHEDENIRIAAAYAISKLGSPGYLEIVRKAITSEKMVVRANAALLLGKTGDRNSLKFLYWALRHNDSDAKVKFNAVEAIAALGDERIYPKLWSMLISAYADDRVVGIKAMGALGNVKARDSLVTMLDDDVLEVRLAAAEQLGKLNDSTGQYEVLNVFTKDLPMGLDEQGLERVKVWAAFAIGRIKTKTVTRFLPTLLEDESRFVRIAAAKAVLQCAQDR